MGAIQVFTRLLMSTAGFNAGLGAAETRMGVFANRMSSMGRTLTTSVSLPLAAIAGLSVKTALSFEDAWVGVTKTVDGTAQEMQDLRGELRALALSLPSTQEEIFGVAEAAGQLGIARGDIVSFAKVMVDLGNTTNLESREAATALARMANVMGTAPENFSRLGSAIVDLGNSFETSEAEIVALASRLVGASRVVGISEANTLALATAMSSVGINAELGGTAMSNAMLEIQSAVAKGGEELRRFALTAGMSSEDFKAQWQQDATGAILAFSKGLQRSGENAGLVLDGLGIRGARAQQTFLKLAVAGDLLTDTVDLSNRAWAENTALLTEAEKKYASGSSRLKVQIGLLRDAGAELGEELVPHTITAVKWLAELAAKFSALESGEKKAVVGTGAFLLALGPMLSIGGRLVKVFSGLGRVLVRLAPVLRLGSKGVLRFLGPLGLALSLIPDLFKVFKDPEVKSALGDLGAQFKGVSFNLEPLMKSLTLLVNIIDAVVVPSLKWLVINLIHLVSVTAAVLRFAFSPLMAGLALLQGDFQRAGDIIGSAWENLFTTLQEVGEAWPGRIMQLGRDIVHGLIDGIKDVLPEVGQTLEDGLKAAWEGTKDFLGISSPSKLFAKIGESMMEGVGVGVAKGQGVLGSATAGGAHAIGSSALPIAGRGGGVSMVFHINGARNPRDTGDAVADRVMSVLRRMNMAVTG